MGFVDFHSHVLPGIDDGSKTVEQSVAMLRAEAEQGVRQVIATPHFYINHQPLSRFLEQRREAENALREALREHPELPDLSVGAEVAFFEGISHYEGLHELAIAGSRCILIEMPMSRWSDRQLQELTEIRQKQKLIPIIAHVERYMGLPEGKTIPDRLSMLPVYLQVNARMFERWSTRRTALRLLKNRQIHLLGSDCHDLKDRAPNIKRAETLLRKKMPEAISWIEEQQNKILNT